MIFLKFLASDVSKEETIRKQNFGYENKSPIEKIILKDIENIIMISDLYSITRSLFSMQSYIHEEK